VLHLLLHLLLLNLLLLHLVLHLLLLHLLQVLLLPCLLKLLSLKLCLPLLVAAHALGTLLFSLRPWLNTLSSLLNPMPPFLV